MIPVNILGTIGAQDSDYAYLHQFGQDIVYDGLQQILGDHNDDMAVSEAMLVDEETTLHQEKYKLPGAGRMQKAGIMSRGAEVKATGEWSVGYPLDGYNAAVGINATDWAYMTPKEFDRQVTTILKQNRNMRRSLMLRAIFNNLAQPYVDAHWPTFNVQPLANGDGTLYPPVVGSEVNGGQNAYFGVPSVTTNAAGQITFNDSTNPIPLLVNQLEQNFGTPTGGSEIVVFCHSDQTASVENLAGFDTIPNRFVTYGLNVSLVEPDDVPQAQFPGRVLGETNSAIVVEWRWMPKGYMFGLHYGAPKPLKRRVDPAGTGIPPGLHMVSEEGQNPFLRWEWLDRLGIGVANRLNGAVVDLTAANPNQYTVPAQYA